MTLSLAHWYSVGLVAVICQASAFAEIVPATQSVSVTLSPKGKLTVPAGLTLVNGSLAFSAFTASPQVLFRVRTSAAGAGTITVRAASDFTPSGGPSIATGMLTFTCAPAAYGSGCTGTQTVSTTVQRPVINLPASACTGGGNGCSSADPATIDLSFRLENDVSVPTGAYSVQLTFTVSTT